MNLKHFQTNKPRNFPAEKLSNRHSYKLTLTNYQTDMHRHLKWTTFTKQTLKWTNFQSNKLLNQKNFQHQKTFTLTVSWTGILANWQPDTLLKLYLANWHTWKLTYFRTDRLSNQQTFKPMNFVINTRSNRLTFQPTNFHTDMLFHYQTNFQTNFQPNFQANFLTFKQTNFQTD